MEDLRCIALDDEDGAAEMAVLLDEIAADQWALDCLNDHGLEIWKPNDWVLRFNISHWAEQWRKGKNLWRLKSLYLEDEGYRYRFIYAFIPKTRMYVVLGVFPRKNFNYEERDPRSQRVLAAYRELADD